MVSKTLVCVALLALVAVCNCGPTDRRSQKIQRPCDDNTQNSDESSQQPCDLIQQNNRHQNKNIQVQDVSSSESDENQRRVNIRMYQEDNEFKEMRHAPEHERVQGSHNNHHYLQQQQTKQNEQKSRHDNESNENRGY